MLQYIVIKVILLSQIPGDVKDQFHCYYTVFKNNSTEQR